MSPLFTPGKYEPGNDGQDGQAGDRNEYNPYHSKIRMPFDSTWVTPRAGKVDIGRNGETNVSQQATPTKENPE